MNTDDARPLPDVSRLRRALLGWYRREARDLPWRRTRDPYAVWISEVMLQQTTVATVIPYYERFLFRFPDLASLAASDEEELLALWSGLGYYRRARNLRAAARIIVARHGGHFPEDPDAIEALPGIGRYTAGAIASNCFGLALPAIDTNAARVLARVFAVAEREVVRWALSASANTSREAGRHTQGVRGSARAETRAAVLWRIAEALVPPESPGDWTQALMELGATVCRPAAPDCGICPAATECAAFASGDLAPYSLTPKIQGRHRPRLSSSSTRGRPAGSHRGPSRRSPHILLVRRDT
jgi:A/G-specific adenine glycosylase